MSGAIIGGVVGAVIGFFAGGNVALGWMIGSAIGGAYDYSQIPDTLGPRLQDRTVQLSSYGAQIPIVYGAVRLAGNVIWPANFDVKENENSESTKGGPETITFTYTASFALLLCEGPIGGIGRIWMNKKLVSDPNSGMPRNGAIAGMTLYLGTETQQPDPLMVATDGSAPAYRGWAYIVFEDLELTNSGFGNRIPLVEVEVFGDSVTIGPLPEPRRIELGASASIPSHEVGLALVDPVTGLIWSTRPMFNENTVTLSVTNDDARRRVVFSSSQFINYWGYAVFRGTRVTAMCYVPGVDPEIWIATDLEIQGATFDPTLRCDEIWVIKANPPGRVGGGVARGWASTPTEGTFINALAYNPITKIVMGFRGGGVNIIVPPIVSSNFDPLFPSTVISSPYDFVLGNGALPTGVPEQVVVTPIYFCVFMSSTVPEVSTLYIHRLDNYAFVATFAIGGAAVSMTPFYDPDLDRIIHRTTYKNFEIIHLATLTLTTHSFTIPLGADTVPLPGSSVATGVYAGGKYIFGAWGLPGDGEGSTLYKVDPVTLVCEYAYTYENTTSTEHLYHPLLVPKDASKPYIYSFKQSTVKRLYFNGKTEPSPVPLSEIVTDLSTRVPFGLSLTDVNTTSLTDTVDGYLVGQQMTRRQAIEPLMAAYFFDGVESDHQIKFVKRGGAPAITIAQDDRAAHEEGSEMPPHLAIERVSELELPWTIDVSYIERARDYEVSTQYDRRITRNANDPRRLEMAITMTAAKAKQVAMVNLYLPWLRSRFGFSTTVAYAKYEPTDVAVLPTENATYTARITGRSDQGNGIIRWEAELEDGVIYTQNGTVATSTWLPQTINDPGATELELLDMPILRDADDNPGYYVAMGGYLDGWPGAQLFKSTDSGVNYTAMLSSVNEATIGEALGVLGNFTAGNIFDNGNSVSVEIITGGTLISATETQVLNGSNLAVIGAHGRWEVINFKTATLTATNTYLLSGLLRGRRGTEWATGLHEIYDKFILASTSNWHRPIPDSAEIGLARKYKAPPFGTLLTAALEEDFTNSGVGLEPYAPVDLLGARDASNNLSISWHRRSRIGYGALHTIVPLGEATESYSTDIMNGTAVVRTIASVTPTAAYTAAQQVTDFGSTQASVAVKVYQLSATVGRGYALTGSV